MGPHSLYRPGPISPPHASVHLQETSLALLLIRLVLLRYPPQLHLHLVLPLQFISVCCLLLSIARITR